MTSPRLLAIDLDGTLLDSSGAPHQVDLRALWAARAAGIDLTIVTGRLFSGTEWVARQIGIEGPVVCVDGSHIVEVRSRTTLIHHGIRGDHALELRQGVARARSAAFLFMEDRIVHDELGVAYLPFVRTWSHSVQLAKSVVAEELWSHERGITAVVVVGDAQHIAELAAAIRGSLGEVAAVMDFPLGRSGAWGLMARSRQSSKGAALQYLSARAGYRAEEVVAVGDWLNDVSMFEFAGRSFAMGHSPMELKQRATDVLEETRDTGGGVARALAQAFGVLG